MKLTRFFFCVLVAAVLAGGLTLRTSADEPAAALPDCVQIRNVQFDRLLRPRDANNQDGTPLVLYPAQPWKCMTWNVRPTAEGLVSLKNRFTAKTFSAAEDGTIKQIPFDTAKTWKFEKLADGNYRIVDPAAPGKVLTARDEDTLALYDWKDAPGQRWEVRTAPAHLTM